MDKMENAVDLQELIEELENEESRLNSTSYDSSSTSFYQIQIQKVNRLTAIVEEAQKESTK